MKEGKKEWKEKPEMGGETRGKGGKRTDNCVDISHLITSSPHLFSPHSFPLSNFPQTMITRSSEGILYNIYTYTQLHQYTFVSCMCFGIYTGESHILIVFPLTYFLPYLFSALLFPVLFFVPLLSSFHQPSYRLSSIPIVVFILLPTDLPACLLALPSIPLFLTRLTTSL